MVTFTTAKCYTRQNDDIIVVFNILHKYFPMKANFQEMKEANFRIF